MTDEEKLDLLAWILKKWDIPKDSTKGQVQGLMHVAHHEAEGYRMYIVAYRCNDKQGEIARLSVRVKELEEGIRAEVAAIPNGVTVREDGADEDVLASLAVSVGKLKEYQRHKDGDAGCTCSKCAAQWYRDVSKAEIAAGAVVCGLQEIAAGLHPDPGLRAREILMMVGAQIESKGKKDGATPTG